MTQGTLRCAALVAALTFSTALTPASALATQDPWPNSEVLTRLFVVKPSDGARLVRETKLSQAQVSELKRLVGSERSYGAAAAKVLGRGEAQQLNQKLAAMRAEKDRKVRLALGNRYPSFREWVRGWWAGQVAGSESRTSSKWR